LQLPGVITSGPKPGAAAGIRPRQTASAPTEQKRAATSAPKNKADPKTTAAKATPAKITPAKATAPKKKKPVEDDE
jgi:hypothetical protein